MLLTAGERISMALLAIAISTHGYEARSFTGSQAGVITDSAHGKARIIDVTPGRIRQALDEGHIAIVAGFQGVSQDTKDITTLDDLKHDMSELSIAFDNTRQPLGDAHDRVATGAGQFKAKLEGGAAQFLLSWEVAFRTMSDGSGIVANSIGKTSVDLKATDISYTSAVQL
jgi:hypothetical protein